jgi:exopolysaccharide biosynthesis polyprenyl glycosylphosphotransferase
MDGKIADAAPAALQERRPREARLRTRPSRAEGTFIGRSTAAASATRRRESIFRRGLVAADALAVLGAFTLTIGLSSRSVELTRASIIGLPILIAGAKISGLYDRDDALLRKTTLDEAPKLFQLAALCALIAWLGGSTIVSGRLDRHQALFLWIALAGMLMLMRTLARAVALRVAPEERCLVIGDADTARTIGGKLSGHGGIRASVVAHLDLDKVAPWTTDARSENELIQVRVLARDLDVHRAIVAPRSADGHEVLDLVRTLEAVGVRVSIVPRLLEVVGSSVVFDDLHGVTVMGVRRFELSRSSAFVKRSFDVFCASLGLLVVSPLMIVAAIAIKLDSRGPILFRQLRVGRHGNKFHIYKFRTMVADAEELKEALRDRNEAQEGLFKIVDDPRVTRVGRFLRKTALDEMPQLLNILRGEMSLVGPRPLVLDEDLRVEGWHRRRLELTPGMTGHWQILGPARVPLREMAAIDYLYVANWSLWTDIKILLRTIPYVMGCHGL